MDVRVATVHVRPGKLDEFVHTYRREQLPVVQAAPGFQEARLLTDPHTNTAIGITVWATEAEAKATPSRVAPGGLVTDLVTAPATIAYYELSVRV